MKNRLDLLRKTRLAWLESPPRLRADSPEPGEVLALGPTRHHNVEWVVLARAREHRDWLLVVAADALSLVGSGDLSVHAPNHGGPLVMRCRVGGWLDIGPIA